MFIQRYATAASRARGFYATGGTVVDYDGYRVHRFRNVWGADFVVHRGSGTVQYWLVGPGAPGGGGQWVPRSLGGRGGELVTGSIHVKPGVYPVFAGAGWRTPPSWSTFAGATARHSSQPAGQVSDMGSTNRRVLGGGGGGPAGPGGDGGGATPGAGVDGVLLNLWGTPIRVGAGGGGSVQVAGPGTYANGPGGLGGGGMGGRPDEPGQDGTGYGSGGGAGGGRYTPGSLAPDVLQMPGIGSDGLVVIRYPLELLEAA